MARARMISTDASIDPELNSLTLESMTLYLLTIAHLDRDGLIDANPMRLSAQAAPLRPELRDRAGALINEWIEAGLVERYPTSRNQYALYFRGFRKHNRFEYTKDRPSELPPPPGWTRTKHGLVPDDPEACFRMAAALHPENKYRKALIDYAQGEETSRTVLEPSRSPLEQFSPRSDKIRLHDDDDVHTYTLPHPGFGNGGDARGGTTPTAITAALAEHSDDELRIAADQIGSLHGLHDDFNGWPRFLSGATRHELTIVLAWCARWSDSTPDELSAIKNLPALLRSKVKSGDWPGLSRTQIANLQNSIEDALYYAIPEVKS
jgi:hypothetical protein